MTELELVDAEFSEKASSKTSSPDNTVQNILLQYRAELKQGLNELAGNGAIEQAKQSLDSHYLSIFLELVGEPEKGMESKITKTPNGLVIDEWGDIASGFRNALRQELRTALQDRLGEK